MPPAARNMPQPTPVSPDGLGALRGIPTTAAPWMSRRNSAGPRDRTGARFLDLSDPAAIPASSRSSTRRITRDPRVSADRRSADALSEPAARHPSPRRR